MIDKKQLIKIMEDLHEVTKGKNIDMKTIFQEACTYQRGLMINENKKSYQKPKSFYHEEPATDKQKGLLKRLNKGIVPAGITKREASKLIGELKEKS